LKNKASLGEGHMGNGNKKKLLKGIIFIPSFGMLHSFSSEGLFLIPPNLRGTRLNEKTFNEFLLKSP
jgi:hypothetical protein